ncbi:MAPK/MAK/MRK overlapping kinase [Diplogelasinospora grovesii]|uniref:MAPK/MAK/MRK overlapping kinase n=1 Tax=Diplogelasinospora grovesii TaxID=303347 RepID=A0AAN6S3M6_9PEZI|nr:MAPK/MAK/MRK overlapping kinase [Diplogelasinospora grovesii]
MSLKWVGSFVPARSKLFWGGNYFFATIPERLSLVSSLDLNRLNKTAISPSDIWPPIEPGLSRAPVPLPADCFLKQASLVSYDEKTEASTKVAGHLLKEAKVCGVLKRHPHPNIATYLGCVVEDGSVKGLCFVRLEITKPFDTDRCRQGIEEGVRHLQLYYFMLDEADNNPVIIDFDSCVQEGQGLGLSTGAIGWSNGATIATRENDYFGLSKLRDVLDNHNRNSR